MSLDVDGFTNEIEGGEVGAGYSFTAPRSNIECSAGDYALVDSACGNG